MRLAHLPAEILGRILDSKDSSYLVVTLWNCGDRLLSEKLTSGVQYVHLVSNLQHRCHWPRVLSELRHLRYLSINSDEDLLDNMNEWMEQLTALPATLEHLGLNSPDSSIAVAVLLPRFFDSHEPRHPIIARFPRLSSLDINAIDAADLEFLPPTITDLKTDKLCFNGSLYFPSSLQFLDATLVFNGPSQFSVLDSKLWELGDWLSLPSELTERYLDGRCDDLMPIDSRLAQQPPNCQQSVLPQDHITVAP